MSVTKSYLTVTGFATCKTAVRKGKAQSIVKITGKQGKSGGFFLYNRQQRKLTRLVSFVSRASYKPISVSYSQETGEKSVYTQANMQLLQGYIIDL